MLTLGANSLLLSLFPRPSVWCATAGGHEADNQGLSYARCKLLILWCAQRDSNSRPYGFVVMSWATDKYHNLNALSTKWLTLRNNKYVAVSCCSFRHLQKRASYACHSDTRSTQGL
jgi:hypothetical protein